jgi:hypothetical protein
MLVDLSFVECGELDERVMSRMPFHAITIGSFAD